MKETELFKQFRKSTVFGFDMGTMSMGYAVRRENEWLEEGVITFSGEGDDLKSRRGFRQQRRRVKNRKYRRNWLENQLENAGFPTTASTHHSSHPVELRHKAIRGEKLTPVEFYTALQHLFKKRGFEYKVPWANELKKMKRKDDEEDTGVELSEETLRKDSYEYPCEFLYACLRETRKAEKNATPAPRMIGYKFPRKLIEKEFRQIVKEQSRFYPVLMEKVKTTKQDKERKMIEVSWTDWILYGNCNLTKGIPVYDKKSEKDRGVHGIRFAHIYNRGPGLDIDEPLDTEGRPLHRIKRNKKVYKEHQFEVAIRNFRVIDPQTGQKLVPPPELLVAIKDEFRKKKGKIPKITVKGLAPIVHAFEYDMVEGQTALTSESYLSGRSSFSGETLKKWKAYTDRGEIPPDNPQPVLKRKNETSEKAARRFLADMAFPLGKHRLEVYLRLLNRLIRVYGYPDFVVVEAIRDLAIGKKAKKKIMKKQNQNKEENVQARKWLVDEKKITHPAADKVRLIRLLNETDWSCPYCLKKIKLTDLDGDSVDIDHIVPRAEVVCNEYFNLTASHTRCNEDIKNAMTPFEAFSGEDYWEKMREKAETWFGKNSLKYRLFTGKDARASLRERYSAPLMQTAYIARAARTVTLMRMSEKGWLTDDGRDPTTEKENPVSRRFMVTNGGTTALLRSEWGLKDVLFDIYRGENPDIKRKKVRLDVRNHVIDAMVIACTYTPLARRIAGEKNKPGYFHRINGSIKSIPNPFELSYRKVSEILPVMEIHHHISHHTHGQYYDSTLLGKREKEGRFYKRVPVESLELKKRKQDKPIGFKHEIYPCELGEYILSAIRKWENEHQRRYEDVKKEYDKEKSGKKKSTTASKLEDHHLKKEIFSRLCFSHFQRWRSKGGQAGEFEWPNRVKIPIRNVRIKVKDAPDAVMEIRPRTFVVRKGYRGLEVYKTPDGSRMGILVPYWKTDPLYKKERSKIPAGSQYQFFLRTGMSITIKEDFIREISEKRITWRQNRENKFKIKSISAQMHLLPVHINSSNKDELKSVIGNPSGYYTLAMDDVLKNIDAIMNKKV